MRHSVGILVRGMAMGAADIVPGVSGGTVALITGIYDRLVAAIAGFDATLLRRLWRRQWRGAWQHVDGSFLLTLLSGIGIAVISLATLIDWLLRHFPQPLWAFFLGLVGASALVLWRSEVRRPTLPLLLIAALGAAVAVAIALAPTAQFLPGLPGFFLAGAIAICAMILPGISGSFILLLLGMYQPVISALVGRDIAVLVTFGAGCVAGLLVFSKLLHWLLAHQRHRLMALLTGFLGGSMVTLWPWQRVLSTVMDRHGELRPVQRLPISPWAFSAEGGDPQLALCLIACLAGIGLIGLTHRWVRAEAG